jgi:hypothetical protein
MSPDSITQFNQATSGNYNGWHPPLMAYFWGLLLKITGLNGSLLGFHLLLLFVGITILIFNIDNLFSRLLLVITPLLPWVFNFAGVIWKDVGLAFSLLAILSFFSINNKKLFLIFIPFIFLLLVYATSSRHNSFLAIIPFVIYYSYLISQNNLKIKTLLLSILILMSIILASVLISKNLINENFKERAINYVLIDDLSFLSLSREKSLSDVINYKDIKKCKNYEIGNSKYIGKLYCLEELAGERKKYTEVSLWKDWFSAVSSNTLKYLWFRIHNFSYLLRIPNKQPYYFLQGGVFNKYFSVNKEGNEVYKFYLKTVAKKTPLLLRPGFWMVLSILLLYIFIFCTNRSKSRYLGIVALSSGILYTLSYLPATTMADLRYVYWSLVSCTVSIPILLNCNFNFKLLNSVGMIVLFIFLYGLYMYLNVTSFLLMNG